jgi:hypothetical protein
MCEDRAGAFVIFPFNFFRFIFVSLPPFRGKPKVLYGSPPIGPTDFAVGWEEAVFETGPVESQSGVP